MLKVNILIHLIGVLILVLYLRLSLLLLSLALSLLLTKLLDPLIVLLPHSSLFLLVSLFVVIIYPCTLSLVDIS